MPVSRFPFGPSYDEMAHPELIEPTVRAAALEALQKTMS